MIDANQADIHAIAKAVYFESRGEPFQCQVLVASVVKNRMKDRGMTASQVVAEKGQFTWHGKLKHIHDKGAYSQSVAVARHVLTNPTPSKYRYFHRGRHGGVRCGGQVFSIAYN